METGTKKKPYVKPKAEKIIFDEKDHSIATCDGGYSCASVEFCDSADDCPGGFVCYRDNGCDVNRDPITASEAASTTAAVSSKDGRGRGSDGDCSDIPKPGGARTWSAGRNSGC